MESTTTKLIWAESAFGALSLQPFDHASSVDRLAAVLTNAEPALVNVALARLDEAAEILGSEIGPKLEALLGLQAALARLDEPAAVLHDEMGAQLEALARLRRRFTTLGFATLGIWCRTRGVHDSPVWDSVVGRALEHYPTGWEAQVMGYLSGLPQKRVAAVLGRFPLAVQALYTRPAGILDHATEYHTASFRIVQRAQLQEAMTSARRWAWSDWADRFRHDGLARDAAIDVLWGFYREEQLESTFRLDTDGSISGCDEQDIHAAGREVGVVHSAEINRDALDEWSQLFADYELVPAFDQLGGPSSEETTQELNGLSVRLRDGWRNELLDAGWVPSARAYAIPSEFSLGMPAFAVTAVFHSSTHVTRFRGGGRLGPVLDESEVHPVARGEALRDLLALSDLNSAEPVRASG